ncbi:MAG: ribonuclease HI [Candidatus Cloacimonetes bacterium]|nr:ribonuclease HI [Candidatus Cloacimonadota bacterium]MBS3767086.1 ribonuclease HI [Candidatus Cloacimonadota bacterium]
MNFVEIYTDGSCKGNPGPGGWAAIIKRGDNKSRISGFEKNTTNNRMELMAAIKGLEALSKPTKVELYSDSNYLVKGMNNWLVNWKKRYWKTAAQKPIKNMDLWQSLDKLNQKHQISWNWVKGHSNKIINEECDTIAKLEIEKNIQEDN